MNARELVSLCERDVKLSPYFQGVFPSDCLPDRVTYPFACVVNSDRQDRPGEHWLAVFIESPHKAAEIFDSYGLEPFGDIYKFARKHAPLVLYSTKWIQSIISRVCGLYAYYYLHKRARGWTLAEISAKFEDFAWTRNDDAVLAWYMTSHG